jgi:hypothetical protein
MGQSHPRPHTDTLDLDWLQKRLLRLKDILYCGDTDSRKDYIIAVEILLNDLWFVFDKVAQSLWDDIRRGDMESQKSMSKVLRLVKLRLERFGLSGIIKAVISGSVPTETNLPGVADIDINLVPGKELTRSNQVLFEAFRRSLEMGNPSVVDAENIINRHVVYTGFLLGNVVDLKLRSPRYDKNVLYQSEFYKKVDSRWVVLITFLKSTTKHTSVYPRVKYMWYEYVQAFIFSNHGSDHGYILGGWPTG